MKIENINIAQALAYQLERVNSDIDMVAGDVFCVTIKTTDDYSYSLLSEEDKEACIDVRSMMLDHLSKVKAKILKEIEAID